jgi:hypothetical protein
MAEAVKPPLRTLDRVIRGTLAALALAAVILAIAEAVARRTLEVPPRPYTPHPLFHLVRTPNYRQMKWSVEEPAYQFEFVANPLGFRGKSMQTVKKPAGTYRIFFVGASTTENQHLPEEKTFAGLVEIGLMEKTKGTPRIEVSNCGIAGYGVARSLSLIEHRILQLEPDLIVLLDAENDLMSSIDERWDPTNANLETDDPTFKEWLMTRSTLVAWLNAKGTRKEDDTRRFFEKRRALARAHPYKNPEGTDLRRFLPSYTDYLRWIALVCKERNVPLVFMTQPTLWKEKHSPEEEAAMWMSDFPASKNGIHLDPKTCMGIMADYNDAIRATAAKEGVLLVDLDHAVPKDLADFCDDAHLTARGNERVATAVIDAIWKDGKLPGR